MMKKNAIIIILAVVIAGALGYFVIGKGTSVQPVINDQIGVKKECPDAVIREALRAKIGTPPKSGSFQSWMKEAFDRLHAEISRNPIKCPIDDRYQLFVRSTRFLPGEEERPLKPPSLAVYLWDGQSNSESRLLVNLYWLLPFPGGNTYTPDHFSFELKSADIVEIFDSGEGYTNHYFISLPQKRLAADYYLTFNPHGFNCCEELSINSMMSLVERKEEKDIALLVNQLPRVDPYTKFQIKEITLNDSILKSVNREISIYDPDSEYYDPTDLPGSAAYRNIEFSPDFFRVTFDVEFSYTPDPASPEIEKINLGRVEVDLK